MCGSTDNNRNNRERKRVVISRAGPAGLLLSSLLLNQNKDATCSVIYEVTLVDSRMDYRSFSKQELSETHRSWMICLSDNGLDAIRTLPALYENYAKGEGLMVQDFNVYLGNVCGNEMRFKPPLHLVRENEI